MRGRSGVRELVHKNRVALDGLLEDPALSVVFFLVYECGAVPPKTSSRVSRAAQTSSSVSRAAQGQLQGKSCRLKPVP